MNNRRRFIAQVGSTALLIPVVQLIPTTGWAADRITLDHPAAGPLGYVHDASTTDIAKFPKRAGAEGAKQFCDNCSQYSQDPEGVSPDWGPCTIFPGVLVAAKGWCNVWVPVP